MRRRWAMGLATALVVAAVVPLPAGAATSVVASWQMNEPAGARTMVDSSGNGVHGQIGSAVLTGVSAAGAIGYSWSNTAPNAPPAKPERLVQINDARLNPGSADFAVEARFRTTRSFGNILQKGQSGTRGGYFKWQIPSGKLACLYRGFDAQGVRRQVAVNSGSKLLNDGAWHTVRCERTATGVVMTIDGALVRRGWGSTGSISNNVPMTIGGKLNCDQIEVTCDYFVGEIDYVRVESGAAPAPPPPPPPSGDAIFADDFTNGMAAWTGSRAMTTVGGTGTRAPSARVDVAGEPGWAYRALGSNHAAACTSVEVEHLSGTGHTLMRLRTAANGPVGRVLVDWRGRLRVRSDVARTSSVALGTLAPGWHHVELCVSTGQGSWDLYVDGDRVLEDWSASAGSAGVGRVQLGDTAAKTWSAHFDNVRVDTAPG